MRPKIKNFSDLICGKEYPVDLLVSETKKYLFSQGCSVKIENIENEITQKASLKVAKSTITSPKDNSSHFGYFCSFEDSSIYIAFIESFERFLYKNSFYCLNNNCLSDNPNSSSKQFDPTDFFGFLNGQDDPSIYDEMTAKPRIGFSLKSGEQIAIPSLYICGHLCHFPLTNSGTALHIKAPQACLNSLLEAWERHTLMLNWLRRKPLTFVVDYASPYSHIIRDIVSFFGYELNLFQYDSELGVPVCVATLTNLKKEHPYFFCGAGSALNFHEAADKSIRECFTIWIFDYPSIKAGLDLPQNDGNQAKLYYNPANYSSISHMFRKDLITKSILSKESPESLLEKLIDRYEPVVFPIYMPFEMTRETRFPYCFHTWSHKFVPLFFGPISNYFVKLSFNLDKKNPLHPF